MRQALAAWQTEPELAGIRDPAELKKLPIREQADCRKMWADSSTAPAPRATATNRELGVIVAALPALPPTADTSRAAWVRWQAGLSVRITLPAELPPLRALLVLDNLVGHKTPALVSWLFAHGVMPLFTPLDESWLNMAESIQRVLKRRARDGQHPTDPDDIMARFGAVAKHWNAAPTPFVWGGKRAARRKRQRERRHAVGGSGAFTRQPIRRRRYGHGRGK